MHRKENGGSFPAPQSGALPPKRPRRPLHMKKLNEILGTEFPFIQGGMASIATGEFAAACSPHKI